MTSIPALAIDGLSRELGDLEQCNTEPVGRIGGVQPHGWALFIERGDRRIQAISQSAAVPCKIEDARRLIGSKLEHAIGTEAADALERALAGFPRADERGMYLEVEVRGELFEVYAYESDGSIALEFTSLAPMARATLGRDPQRALAQFMTRANSAPDVATLARHACVAIREALGFDRVMAYQFVPPSWHGQVIAEDRVAHAFSFDNHRFPASDIPRPARDLYLRNRTRAIEDAQAEPAPIFPANNPLTDAPMDLSDSRLRAVSPIHLEYLRNMGVRASFSFAIMAGDRLWGLIACHHSEPSRLWPEARRACEIVAALLSAQTSQIETTRSQRDQLTFQASLNALFDSLSDSREPVSRLFRGHRDVERVFRATGVARVGPRGLDFAGLTPTPAQLAPLGEWLKERMRERGKRVFATPSLAEADQRWAPLRALASGVLAASFDDGAEQGVLCVFRPEEVQTISWGGDPRKQLNKKSFQGRIHPRASFETWHETIEGRAPDWKPYEIEGIETLRDRVFHLLEPKERLIRELGDALRAARGESAVPR